MPETVAQHPSVASGPGMQPPEWQQAQRLPGLNDLFQNSQPSGPRATSLPAEAWNGANRNRNPASLPVPVPDFLHGPPPPPHGVYPRQPLQALPHHQGGFSYGGPPPWKHPYDIGHDDAPWGSQPQDWEPEFIPAVPIHPRTSQPVAHASQQQGHQPQSAPAVSAPSKPTAAAKSSTASKAAPATAATTSKKAARQSKAATSETGGDGRSNGSGNGGSGSNSGAPGRARGAQNWTSQKKIILERDFIGRILPTGMDEWERVAREYSASGVDCERTSRSIKDAHKGLITARKDTGNPDRPEEVTLALENEVKIRSKTSTEVLSDARVPVAPDSDDEVTEVGPTPVARYDTPGGKSEVPESAARGRGRQSSKAAETFLSSAATLFDPKNQLAKEERQFQFRAEQSQVKHLQEQLKDSQRRYDRLEERFYGIQRERDQLQGEVQSLRVQHLIKEQFTQLRGRSTHRSKRARSPSSSPSRSPSRSRSRSRGARGYKAGPPRRQSSPTRRSTPSSARSSGGRRRKAARVDVDSGSSSPPRASSSRAVPQAGSPSAVRVPVREFAFTPTRRPQGSPKTVALDMDGDVQMDNSGSSPDAL